MTGGRIDIPEPDWEAMAKELLEACKITAKAELYDPATGIIDADVLDIVQDVARAAISRAQSLMGDGGND